jgi:UDP-N-acetylglucosamine 3-dehydrogenase
LALEKNQDQTLQKLVVMDQLPRIAIVGCGAITELFYLPALVKCRNLFQDLILVDSNEGRARELAKKFKLKNYHTNYREILAEVDGTIIAAPTPLHYALALEFIDSGVHVLCEKPLAETADEVKTLQRQSQKMNMGLSANYTRRLFPSFLKVKELLCNGDLGKPLSIKYQEGEIFRWPTTSGFYFNSEISSRGILLDRGAHALDLICWWLGGKPKIVASQNDSFGGREAVARVQFEYNHCIGEVKLSWLGNLPCYYAIQCEKATVEGDVYDFQSFTLSLHNGNRKRIKVKSGEKFYDDFGKKVINNFLDMILKGEKPLISCTDVLDSAEMIDECYGTASRFHLPWYEIL